MTIYGAISAPDLAILRSTETHAVNRYLTVVEPQTVMTAQINQSSFTYPLAQLTIDNVSFGAGFAITDVLQGNDVWIGTSAGARDVFVGRIRQTPTPSPTPTTLYIEEISAGTSGVPQTHYREITNNHFVTVVRTRSIWEMFPRFEDLGGGNFVIRKDWDVAYTDQNTLPNPIANITPTSGNPVGFVDASTGKYRIALTATNSIPVLDGNSIASYSWDIGAGTLVAGALNGATVTVDFDPGQDWVFLQVTDANSKTAYAWLPVAYYDKENNIWPLQLFEISSDVRDLRGHRISFTGNANDLSLADVPHGAQCYVWSEQYFGGDTTEATSDYMMGWAISEETSVNPQFPDIAFEIVGPVPLLDMIAAIPQRIESAASPANWQETIPAYTNVKGAAAYLFYWHYRTLAELCDVRLLAGEIFQATNQPAFGAADLSGTNAGRQFASLAGRLPATFASASDGSIHMVRDPQYLQSRTSIVTRMTITTDDITSIRANRRHRLEVAVVGADGFINNPGGASGVIPVRSQAPGLTPAQATGTTDLKGMIVRSQAELNWLSGAHWAVVNQPWEFEIALGPNFNVFEPALQYRLAVIVSADNFSDPVNGTTFQRMFDLVANPASDQTRNFYIQSVMVDNEGSAQNIALRVVPELTSTPGVTIPIPQPVDYPETVTPVGPPAPPQNTSDFYLNLGTYTTSFVPDSDGVYALVERPGIGVYVLSCDNFIDDPSPTWSLRATLPVFNPGVIGPQTPRYAREFQIDPSNPTRGWIVCDQAVTKSRLVFLCENVEKDTQIWTGQDGIDGNSASNGVRVIQSAGKSLWLAIPTIEYITGTISQVNCLIERNGIWDASTSEGKTVYQKTSLPLLKGGYGEAMLGGDCDKYGNGNIMMAAITYSGGELYRMATVTNFAESGAVATIHADAVGTLNPAAAVVIPWLTPANNPNPNAAFALAAIPVYSNAETVGLMQTTDAGANFTDKTPSVGGDTYGVFQDAPHGICVSPIDGQKWAMCGYPIAGATLRALATQNAGASWSTLASVAASGRSGYYCCEAWVDSDNNEILAFGGTGVVSVATDWATLGDRSGNITALIGGSWVVKGIQPAYRGEYE